MKTALLGVALSASFLAGAVSASPINVTYQSDGVFGSGNLYQRVKIKTAGPGFDGRVNAGMFHMTGNGGLGDFLSFCVDLKQYLHDPADYTVKADLFGAPILSNIGKLFSSALKGATMEVAINTKNKAAGFQLALWEIISDTNGSAYNLSQGNFKVRSPKKKHHGNSAKATAQAYLGGLAGAAGDEYDITYLFSDSYQDVVTGGAMPSPVPLPASGALMIFGLGGFFAARRRRKAS